MLGLSAYRLEQRRTEAAVFYELFESETGRLVGVARSETEAPAKTSRIVALQRALFDSRWFRWLAIPIVLIVVVIGMIAAALGLLSPPPRRQRPRLVVRRTEVDDVLLTIRQSSGMFYDSRVVYDGEGRAVARFRGPSKIALGRMGFGIVDLRGTTEALRDDANLPWLGRVLPAGDGAFRLGLVNDPEAGRVIEDRPASSPGGPTPVRYAIEAGPGLRGDPTGETLLLAVALSLAWSPPPD